MLATGGILLLYLRTDLTLFGEFYVDVLQLGCLCLRLKLDWRNTGFEFDLNI